jgi:hypothetical protein
MAFPMIEKLVSLPGLFIALFSLFVIACSPQPEVTELENFIIGKWQSSGESLTSTSSGAEPKPSRMEFTQAGRIIWDMGTKDKTLHFSGDYTFIDNDTIRVDFIRYSNNSAVWDIICSRIPNESDLLTVRDRNAGTVVARMQRIY